MKSPTLLMTAMAMVLANNVYAFFLDGIKPPAAFHRSIIGGRNYPTTADSTAYDDSAHAKNNKRPHPLVLFMGRAAAVRASTKAKTDARKTKTNAIFGKKIIMAVKQGGSPDPNANRMLNDVIKQAKANSVPVDNIQRAIKRASEGSDGDFKEKTFEAYGFGGASYVISVLTDNDNRATADVKSCVNKREGKIAEQGSVVFLYDRRAVIEVSGHKIDETELLDAAIEAGCEDYELIESGDDETPTQVLADPKEGFMMIEAIKSLGVDEDKIKMTMKYIPKAPVEVSAEDFEKNMQIIDALEELDDVDSVEHNMAN